MAEVVPGSTAERVGFIKGDVVRSINGVAPRDIIEWKRLTAEAPLSFEVVRGENAVKIELGRLDEALGLVVESALFDRVHTCDNHCSFCFIYQLPKGMRRTLYLKDDDYRLSFLFGNFTTLTRFTESDLERVVEERLSPLYVSIHASSPWVRSELLRNVRGGMSLRWISELLAHGITVRAQIVLCPSVNDGQVLDDTLCGLLESFPGLHSIAVVPVGLSRFNPEPDLRTHTSPESIELVRQIRKWQDRYRRVLGRQPLFLADEVYINADIELPGTEHYEGFPMLEDGIGLARSFVESFRARRSLVSTSSEGFFAAFDGTNPTGYASTKSPTPDTALRPIRESVAVSLRRRRFKSVVVLTGEYGARIIAPLLVEEGFPSVAVRAVRNDYFGGNTAVAGLLTFADLSASVANSDPDTVFLLPDVCLNEGRFLDGHSIEDLEALANVRVVTTDGAALRACLEDMVVMP